MQNFLSLLNKKEKVIGVSLTPGIGLEVIELDSTNSVVSNYARRQVDYNFSSREPQNYAQLKSVLIELLDIMKVPPKTKLYFVLPNVLFDFISLPATLSVPEIKTCILSETEKFYLFKKEEPYSAWSQLEIDSEGQKRLVYTAFQKNVVESIKELVADAGHVLGGIECSYSSILKGLYVCGYIDDLLLEQSPWTVMLVNTNSYVLFQFEGKNLINYNEVPVAIKSYSTEEAYDSIVSSSSQLLSNRISSKLFIISQTDDISADILKNHLEFDNSIEAINSNKHSQRPLLEVLAADDFNKTNAMTFSAIAAACWIDKKKWDISLNVLGTDTDSEVYFTIKLFNEEIEVTKSVAQILLMVIAVASLIILGALSLILFGINSSQVSKIEEIDGKIKEVSQKIEMLSAKEGKQEVDINAVIDELAQENVSVINYYDSIATDIPKNVWLTKYYNKSADKIAIRGIAQSIVDIYEYYKNLRIVSPQSNIKLNELKVMTQSEKDEKGAQLEALDFYKSNERLYSFEISNLDVSLGDGAENNSDKKENVSGLPDVYSAESYDEVNIIKKQAPSDNQNNSSGQQVDKPSKQMVPAK